MIKISFTIGLCVLAVLTGSALSSGRQPDASMPEVVVASPKDTRAAAFTSSSQSPIFSTLAQGTKADSIDFGIPEDPLRPNMEKPPLDINTGGEKVQSAVQIPPELSQVIGFTFPDGTIAIKAAPFDKTTSSTQEGELSPVGVVEIGEGGGVYTGTYVVNLDLEGSTQCVSGELRPLEGDSNNVPSVGFVRTELVPNPERVDHPEIWPPITDHEMQTYDNSAMITADSVCFVLESGEGYFRYCSVPGSALSAMNNTSQYDALVKTIQQTAARFDLEDDIETSQTISTLEDILHINQCNHPDWYSEELDPDEACRSDITVAPVTQNYLIKNFGSVIGLPTFQKLVPVPSNEREACTPCKSPYTVHSGDWVWKIGRRCNISPYAIIRANGLYPPYWLYPGDKLILPRNAPPFPHRPRSNLITSQLAFALGNLPFSDALASFALQDEPSTKPISVTVGVVKVHREIYTATDYLSESENPENIVHPGDYRLDYWFVGDQTFFAATLSGFRDDGIEVINQQIPAVPAAFINADGTEPVSAQISACRIFRRCAFFQRRCP